MWSKDKLIDLLEKRPEISESEAIDYLNNFEFDLEQKPLTINHEHKEADQPGPSKN